MILDRHPAYPEDTRPLRYLGYWRTMDRRFTRDPLPDPADWVDADWGQAERMMVVEHLRAGRVLHEWLGSSTCRFCGLRPNGHLCLTDGTYVWPSGLAHQVRAHGVRLPDEFVAHCGRALVEPPSTG